MIRIFVGGTLLAGTRTVVRGLGRILLTKDFEPSSEPYNAEGGWMCHAPNGDRLVIRMKTMTTRYYDVADEPADPDIRSEAAFLREIDLLIWVLDSQRSRIDGNRESLEKLQNSLARLGRDPSTVPAVMVLNKRDLMDVQTESEMANLIVWRNRCSVPMIASEGAGFVELMSAVRQMLAKHGRFIQLGPTT